MKTMNLKLISTVLLALLSLLPYKSEAFCGFYVAKADTKLFNQASKVVLVRDGDKTVLTMANDFQGDPKEFAVVIPVPTFLEKEQIHVGDPAVIDHLDAYTAPRLVEYFDSDPCLPRMEMMTMGALKRGGTNLDERRANSLGVKIEAQYQVGEYDILILNAEQSGGLETWLKENGYKIPEGATQVLESYIKQNMRFFVAKVNLEEQAKLGFTFLRPLQVAYDSPKFMLPIRLGTVNANGTQELFVFTLTKQGRVNTTNYRTVKLPEGVDIPLFIKNDFPNFYKAMFSEAVRKDDMRTVMLEYAWDMGWCDPCAAEPLSNDELKKLGVFWANESPKRAVPMPSMSMQPAPNVYVTRLHVRYDAEHFPEDLMFAETPDRTNFQARFVLRHPWTGDATCPAAEQYKKALPERLEKEVTTLASLTGWDANDLRKKVQIPNQVSSDDKDKKWWKKLWG